MRRSRGESDDQRTKSPVASRLSRNSAKISSPVMGSPEKNAAEWRPRRDQQRKGEAEEERLTFRQQLEDCLDEVIIRNLLEDLLHALSPRFAELDAAVHLVLDLRAFRHRKAFGGLKGRDGGTTLLASDDDKSIVDLLGQDRTDEPIEGD
ncbi:hypothetical protein BJY59DRAFT_35448 [Rhodotorula toruloides]